MLAAMEEETGTVQLSPGRGGRGISRLSGRGETGKILSVAFPGEKKDWRNVLKRANFQSCLATEEESLRKERRGFVFL